MAKTGKLLYCFKRRRFKNRIIKFFSTGYSKSDFITKASKCNLVIGSCFQKDFYLLGQRCSASQITINETAYEKIKESFNCNKVSEVMLKNKSKPIAIYDVAN